jgi:aminoglycoside phosphotransferase (APT) family kinase protein
VTDLPGLDLDRLRAYLGSGELRGTLFAGGRSNLTYAVTDGTSRWVLRRPPLGHVLPTAHDMSREHKVLAALSKAGFPCPAPVLHTLDPAAIGLGDFGRPAGFNERQVRRWKKQLDASHSREVPGIEELHARLAVHIPDGRGSVVHGDYRLDNVLIGPRLDIRAVLDWEMSTLGDPLSDLALMLVYAGRPLLTKDGRPRASNDVPGHPGLDEMAEHYAKRSGHDVGDLHWYVGFAAFKLAVILEGVHYRFVHGQTVGAGFDSVGDMVAPLVAQGHQALEGH